MIVIHGFGGQVAALGAARWQVLRNPHAPRVRPRSRLPTVGSEHIAHRRRNDDPLPPTRTAPRRPCERSVLEGNVHPGFGVLGTRLFDFVQAALELLLLVGHGKGLGDEGQRLELLLELLLAVGNGCEHVGALLLRYETRAWRTSRRALRLLAAQLLLALLRGFAIHEVLGHLAVGAVTPKSRWLAGSTPRASLRVGVARTPARHGAAAFCYAWLPRWRLGSRCRCLEGLVTRTAAGLALPLRFALLVRLARGHRLLLLAHALHVVAVVVVRGEAGTPQLLPPIAHGVQHRVHLRAGHGRRVLAHAHRRVHLVRRSHAAGPLVWRRALGWQGGIVKLTRREMIRRSARACGLL
mmetsp:Transcript_24354/g.75860  ORF Transcript_24354/g.75860 Transcript_24354/m.75860 type:complete len:353 (+) Transcript_24354:307-1365(+)